jgi:phosphoribosylanthranilate isomerase
MRTRVKICAVASPAEARAAAHAGADAVGIAGPMPPSAETRSAAPIETDTARAVFATAPPGVQAWLVTAETHANGVLQHLAFLNAAVVQITRRIDPGDHALIRGAAPWVRIVQVVRMQDEAALELAKGYARTADALLLDSGKPDATIADIDAPPRAHDWSACRQIVSMVDKPVYLAGGLNEANVGEAIQAVRPFGVDLTGGVRTMGKLDARKLSAFFAAVRMA